MSSHFIDIPADDFTLIAVRPSAVKTTEDLRKYDPQVRHCFFDGERQLRFFRFYTQANCEYECYIRRLLDACGCVAFFMPHSRDTRMCQSADEKSCHCEFREHWGRARDCGCLASCTSVSYDTEITSSKREVNDEMVEHVSVYFKKDYFLRVKRGEAIGWASFWSAIGGFLGLLMGASVLSMIEVIYGVFFKHVLDGRSGAFEGEGEVSGVRYEESFKV
jgi:amiloride-sensitive sodium channel